MSCFLFVISLSLPKADVMLVAGGSTTSSGSSGSTRVGGDASVVFQPASQWEQWIRREMLNRGEASWFHPHPLVTVPLQLPLMPNGIWATMCLLWTASLFVLCAVQWGCNRNTLAIMLPPVMWITCMSRSPALGSWAQANRTPCYGEWHASASLSWIPWGYLGHTQAHQTLINGSSGWPAFYSLPAWKTIYHLVNIQLGFSIPPKWECRSHHWVISDVQLVL